MVIINYVLMCIIFGTTFLAIKIGVDSGLPPFLSGGIRFFIAGFLLFLIMLVKEKNIMRLLVRKELFLSGVGLTFGTFATLYWAEQYVTSGIAAVLSATGPMLIIVIQSIILRHKVRRTSIVGCMIGVIGVLFLILPSFSLEVNSYWIIGCFAIILGEVFYASGTIYTKSVSKIFEGIHPVALNAVQMMYGGILLFILGLFTEEISVNTIIQPASLLSLFYLIVIGSMVGHSLFYWLVVKTDPVFPSTWLYISPFIAVVVGVLFYDEFFSWLTGVGAVTICIGMILINYETLKERVIAQRSKYIKV